MHCKNLSFLVVEDQEFQRRMLVQLLTNLGARDVHDAAAGQAALRVIDNHQPIDVVICDVMMPGMDGIDFVRRWSERGDPTSLIVMSAINPDILAMVANMALAYKVRLLGVGAKPLTAAKLRPLLEMHHWKEPLAPSPETAFSFEEITQAWTCGEFECWYELQVHLGTGAFRSMGAVPRWRHPTKGVLEPQTFLPAIAARGLRDDFAWLQIQRAAAQCRLWQRNGRAVNVSANLAFESLADAYLPGRIQHTLQAEELDPRSMVLTVDESTLTGPDVAHVLENLARLRLLGFELGIEDFGKGTMATDHLALASFSELRIHSSLVMGLDSAGPLRAALTGAVEIAEQLKAKPVAVGINSKEEWALLREWGCRYGCGPFIARPMPATEVLGWLARWQERRDQ